MPEKWWDKLRETQVLPSWFHALTKWATSLRATHMHTQTFRSKLSGWEAQRRYLAFLAEHSSPLMIRAVLYAVEQHPGGHGAHIHALWRTPFDTLPECSSGPLLYRFVKERGNISMGFSRLWPIDGQSAHAAAYCLKYIVKGLKALESRIPPGPMDPMEREKLWGLWTPPPPRGGPHELSTML